MDGDALAEGVNKTKDLQLKPAFEQSYTTIWGSAVADGFIGEYLIDNVGQPGYGRRFVFSVCCFSEQQAHQHHVMMNNLLARHMPAGAAARHALLQAQDGGWDIRVRPRLNVLFCSPSARAQSRVAFRRRRTCEVLCQARAPSCSQACARRHRW